MSETQLSLDAKIVAGAVFGWGRATELTMNNIESRLTARAKKAIDELKAAGLVTHRPLNRVCGDVYTGSPGCAEFRQIAMKQGKGFDLTEPAHD